ncbi:DNA alkylation repair protein (plasmid) [Coraliomargarita sp. W4R53]
MTEQSVEAVLAELAELEDPRMREVNERHGDDHGVNLAKLRGIAKTIGKDDQLARELWATDETAAQLVALLICRPKSFQPAQLDAMLRQARASKVRDWVINYVVKKGPHAEELRLAWLEDPDPMIASAGWALNAEAVVKRPEVLDLTALLDTIDASMKSAPDRLQWEMNNTLAAIGINHPAYRERALAIGERLEVLKDYPTPPNCTSPYAPIWIGEMVRRQTRDK